MDAKIAQSNDVGAWYKPSESIKEFHASKARIRALIGGRGSGKTTAIAVEAIGHCFYNAGAKAYILRKTQDSNQDTTLETFEHQVFPNMGTAYQDTGISLFKIIDGGKCFRLPSRRAVELYNEFQAAHPNATKAQKLTWLESVGIFIAPFSFLLACRKSDTGPAAFVVMNVLF